MNPGPLVPETNALSTELVAPVRLNQTIWHWVTYPTCFVNWRDRRWRHMISRVEMFRSEKIEDGLHGVKCDGGDLNNDRYPVGHGSVPKTRQFESFKLFSVLGFS